MQMNLTPFRKTRRPGAARKAAPALQLEWLDELDDCYEAIETVAGLLVGYGEDVLDGALARGAAFLIIQRTRRLKALREQIGAAP